MLEFISEVGDRRVHHIAYRDGQCIWEGPDPMTLLDMRDYVFWPCGEVMHLCDYLLKHSDLYLTAEWQLSPTTGVSGITFFDETGGHLYGTIFVLFEGSPLEQIRRA
ncbi:hypothetical protein [Rhizobium sp. S163]|uniref:hypothetical protein n=1 Tax=Rhizobium sp. S163 TaxID=3055039 RepID=UPI0025A98F40|nr:hypothetical protein [Rhizobium sp. S163]MDM9644778.1 hypothetical protein [Rhizobium sp. S163]